MVRVIRVRVRVARGDEGREEQETEREQQEGARLHGEGREKEAMKQMGPKTSVFVRSGDALWSGSPKNSEVIRKIEPGDLPAATLKNSFGDLLATVTAHFQG